MPDKPTTANLQDSMERNIYNRLTNVDNIARTLSILQNLEIEDDQLFPLASYGIALEKTGLTSADKVEVFDFMVRFIDWERIAQGVTSHLQELFQKMSSPNLVFDENSTD